MGKRGLFFAVVLLIALLGWEVYDNPSYEPGTRLYKLDLRVFGMRRSYLLHFPKDRARSGPMPLVLVLHGGFGNARGMEKETGFSQIADREGFLVAYPNGVGLFGRLQHWNAGHCCGFAMKRGVDDVGFLSAVIHQVGRQAQVDPSRVYIAGYSNGGMLAYLYAAGNPDTVAAVAGISATVGSRISPDQPEMRIERPAAPVPVIAFHGLRDETVPYGGGRLSSPYGYVSVRESMNFWVKANRCAPEPIREEIMGGRIVRSTWKGKERGREVVLYTVKGWGHALPTRHFTMALPESDPLRGFDAPEIIWEFFKSRSRTSVLSH